jgi:hypothetical protein
MDRLKIELVDIRARGDHKSQRCVGKEKGVEGVI